MKISFLLLFIVLILIVIKFTKVSLWFNPKPGYIVGGFLLFCFIRFMEIHRANKKRRDFIGEIRGGY